MKKFHLTASLMLFASCLGLSAQTGPSLDYILPESNPYLVPPGPEAASFLQYGQVPVSYSTGIPDVSYPIYTIRSGSLTLPVTLNYLGGGIKVTDQASWTGLGWLLNAGGVIHRSINDLPDKPNPDLPTSADIRQTNDPYVLQECWGAYNSEYRTTDKMRDRYDFSFGGNSGTFYILNDHDILQIPYSDNRIEYTLSASGEPIGFVITSSDGVSYHFTTLETVVASTVSYSHDTMISTLSCWPYTHISSWYLTKVESLDKGDAIEFVYRSDTNHYFDYSMSQTYSRSTNSENNVISYAYNSAVGVRESISTPVLEEIRFTNGRLVFTCEDDRIDNRKYRLSQISLLDNEGDTLKSIHFNHSYFPGNRMKLDGITYQGYDGTIYDSYDFEYYDEHVVIPDGSSSTSGIRPFFECGNFYSRDLCGYFNGSDNSTMLGYLDIRDDRYNSHIADRSHSPEHARVHSLKKISYITGGETTIIYDTVKYDRPSIPGIRVKEIITQDGDSETGHRTVKRYEYGRMKVRPSIDASQMFAGYDLRVQYHRDGNGLLHSNLIQTYSYSSEPKVPEYHSACKIKYDLVEEYISGYNHSFGAQADTIKNVYEFSNEITGYEPTSYYLKRYAQDNDPNYSSWYGSLQSNTPGVLIPMNPWPEEYFIPGYFIDNYWADGNLIKVSNYRKEDDGYVLVKTTENEYRHYCRNDRVPIGIYCEGLTWTFNGNEQGPYFLYGFQPSLNHFYFFDICVSTGWNKLVGTIVKEYDGDVVKQTSESFQYGNIENESCWHPYVTFSTKMFPDGNTTENSEYAYPVTASGIMNEEARQAMIAGNMISPVIRKKDIVMWDLQDGVRLSSDDYRLFDGKILWNSSSERYDGSAGSQWERKTEVMEHDCKGNPVWLTDESGYSTVIVWGYGNSLPVALIKNATPDAIRQVLDVDLDFKTLGNDLTNMQHLMRLRAMMPEALVYTYSYEPLIGMTAMTDPAGTVWHYAYDSCGRLKETRTSWVAGPPSQTTRSYGYHYHNQ